MSTVFLIFFVILLAIALLYAVRFPPLALSLGIATYGLKQISSIVVPLFQTPSAAFNFMITGVIGISFIYAILRRSISGCRMKEGKIVMMLVWAYLGLFWASSLWSPFNDAANNRQLLPYYAVYVLMLPLLMGNPPQMIRSFRLLWVLLLVGEMGLLLSPAFAKVAGQGRFVVTITTDVRVNEANPLALADAGVFLALTSLLVLFGSSAVEKGRKGVRLARLFCVLLGIGLGLSIAFASSRGETLAGIAAGSLLFAMIKARKVGRVILLQIGISVLLLVVLISVYIYFYDSITEKFPLFSRESIMARLDISSDLRTEALALVLSSPASMIVGIGARGSEKQIGNYPHNIMIQAFVETGIIGCALLCSCYLLAIRFGLRTLSLAKRLSARKAMVFTAFALSLLLYDFLVGNKRGSLHGCEVYMWLLLSIFAFDRIQTSLLGVTHSVMKRNRRNQSFQQTPALGA